MHLEMDKGLGPSLSNIHRVMPSIARPVSVDVVTLFSIINLAVPSRYSVPTKVMVICFPLLNEITGFDGLI